MTSTPSLILASTSTYRAELLARRALEQTSYLLREQLLLKERGGSGIGERRPGRRAGRGKAKDRPTATSLLEDIIARAL